MILILTMLYDLATLKTNTGMVEPRDDRLKRAFPQRQTTKTNHSEMSRRALKKQQASKGPVFLQ